MINNKNFQIAVCGQGGQGVLFLTRLIDEAAVISGKNVISSEVHGMAMRGGSVVSHIKIGNHKSPLIRSGTADYLIAISEYELERNRHLLNKEKHHIVINKMPGNGLSDADITCFSVNACDVAEKIGSVVLSNIVLIGFACGDDFFPLKYETVSDAVKKISSNKMMDLSLKALHEGYKLSFS